MSFNELIGYLDRLGALVPAGGEAGLLDRYRGVMIGLAVGNVLGLPGEGMSAEQLRERHPDGLRTISARELDEPWDDDLAQAVIVAEALLESGRLDLDDLATRLVDWKKHNGRGIGIWTAQVLAAIEGGLAPKLAARQLWEADGRKAAGNGAVMRCAPVALACRRQGGAMVMNSVLSAQVTHADPRANFSCLALNAALACALADQVFEPGIVAGHLAYANGSKAVVEAVGQAGHGFLDSLQLDRQPGIGYTVRTLKVGLWCLLRGADFEETLVEVVSAGGDTDTNGAVAGAVLGARFGAAAIPDGWVAMVPELEQVDELAHRLFEMGQRGAA